MIKSLVLIIVLLVTTSCASSPKTTYVDVKEFDLASLKDYDFIENKPEKAKISKKYQVVNKNFEYAKQDKICNNNSYLGSSNTGVRFYSTDKEGQYGTNYSIYIANDKNSCKFIHLFENVNAFSINYIFYYNTAYFNIINNHDSDNNSGLWRVSESKTVRVSKFYSMSSDYALDYTNGDLYTIEFTADTAWFRKYNKNNQLLDEVDFNDNDYMNLYIKDDKIFFISEVIVDKEAELTHHIISEFSLESVFDNINGNPLSKVEIKNNQSSYNTVEVNVDLNYIIFYNSNSLICDLEYQHCSRYDYITQVGTNNMLLVTVNDIEEKNPLYLVELNTNRKQKILDFATFLIPNMNDKIITLSVYDEKNAGSDNSKYKTIVYKIK
ncbi:hypothetical protein [Mycoplasma sp. P36-A1]|uniref:hypothetical protein n=1 Tax=Mycoplasma sp. P36-A1 TaxID=3252900 RepID=UPI003C2BDE3D